MSNIQKFSGNPSSFSELSQMATQLAKSGYFPLATTPEQAVAKALLGIELGLGMASAMKEIHIIEGKTVISANLYATFVKKSHKYDYKVLRYDAQEVSIMITDKQGNELGTVTKNYKVLEDRGVIKAWNKTKNIFEVKTVWKLYPERMLFSRAISDAVRTFCPDVFTSVVYTPDEFNVPITANGDIDHEAKQEYVNYENVTPSEKLPAEVAPEVTAESKMNVLVPYFEKKGVDKETLQTVFGKEWNAITEDDIEIIKEMFNELKAEPKPVVADVVTKYTEIFRFQNQAPTEDEQPNE